MKKGGKRSRQEDALGTTRCRARRGSRLSALRGTSGRRLGPLAWAFAIPLQSLRAHLQRADQDGNGASTQEGALARPRPGDDRRQKPGQDSRALRGASDDGVSLAPSLSACPCKRQAPRLKRESSRRTKPSSLNPSRAGGPTFAEKGLERRGGTASAWLTFIKTTFPSLSLATGTAPPSTRSCLRSMALR